MTLVRLNDAAEMPQLEHPLRWAPQIPRPHADTESAWELWAEGLHRLHHGDCCGAADRFFEAARLHLDEVWTSPAGEGLAFRLRQMAPLVADVLHIHDDSAGATDVLEFAYQHGRRDGDVVRPLLRLLLDRRELALAATVLDEAQRRDPANPDYLPLRRRLDRLTRR